jgi:hypothetical protein
MNFVRSWNTSNYELYEASFRYQISDCHSGQLVYDDIVKYPVGTPLRSWTGTGGVAIDWTRWYKVRIWGGGSVDVGGNRHAGFSSGPNADPRFDAWSDCF